MLPRKTRWEIWLNRVRVWLPPLLVVVVLSLRRPAGGGHWWGLALVAAGEALRTWAAGHLVKDATLTTAGPYAHVRNPLYLGSLLSAAGFLVVIGDPWVAAAALGLALGVYLPTVRQEERYLRRVHGEGFERYAREVPALLPRLRPYRPAGEERAGCAMPGAGAGFSWPRVWLNQEHRTWLALAALVGLTILRARW